jgi:S-formylglutathione hydrolase FrmB
VDISIVSGWVPWVARGLALAALALAVGWRGGRWRRQLGVGVPVAAAVTLVVALVLSLGSLVPSDVRVPAYAWGFSLALAVWVAVTGWRTDGPRRRAVAVAAVVLTLLVTLGTVNQQSDSFPTLGRLLTANPENVVDTPQLQEIRHQVATTGTLPSQGVLVRVAIPPHVSHFAAHPAYVYLPPSWFAEVTPSLPTLVLLPGEPGSAADWSDQGEADNTADAFAAAHGGVAPIIVMPDPNGYATVDTECVDSRFGRAETYLVDDVPAYAHDKLHAATGPGTMAIAGLSAGGTCSVTLALNHPDVYGTFASYSGFAHPQYLEDTVQQTVDILFDGSRSAYDAHDPEHLLQTGHWVDLAGWFEVGDQDTEPVGAARTLQPLALKAGIATCVLVRPGGHDFDLWSQALVDSFPWLAWRLGLTSEPASEPATCTSP